MSSGARRKALVLALSMGTAAALAVVGTPARQLPGDRLARRLEAMFPAEIKEWRAYSQAGAFIRPADERGKLYGVYDQVLERIYVSPVGEQVMLSVAYGTEQTAGLQVHRPEVCYPSGGFKVERFHHQTLTLADRSIPVTQLHAMQPGRSEPITYWTVLGDTVENDAHAFRLRQLSHGLRRQILDGMLVRVSSIDSNPERAWRVHARFADALVQAVDPSDRARVVGISSAQ